MAPLQVARSSSANEKSALLPALLLVAGNNSSKAATRLGVKFLANMASYSPLDAEETGAVRHNAHPLHEEYLAPLGGQHVCQQLSANPSTLDWKGPFGCRLLPWWSDD